MYRKQLVALQEELNGVTYGAFGLLDNVPMCDIDKEPQFARGQRPFGIALARRIDRGEEDIPARYVASQRAVLKRRLELIETDATIDNWECLNLSKNSVAEIRPENS